MIGTAGVSLNPTGLAPSPDCSEMIGTTGVSLNPIGSAPFSVRTEMIGTAEVTSTLPVRLLPLFAPR